MGASAWLLVDEILGYAEFFLIPAAVIYLLVAILFGGRGRAFRAAALAVFLAITIAQPFGVEAVSMTQTEFEAGDPKPADAEAIHLIGPIGLPIFGFRPYTREIFYVNGDGGDPDTDLKVRSWLLPGLLTNASKVAKLCGSTDEACWSPPDETKLDPDRYANGLHLYRADGEWRYELRTSSGAPAGYPPGREAYFRLRIGVTSIPGLIYWGLAAVLLGTLTVLRGRSLRRAWIESLAELDA